MTDPTPPAALEPRASSPPSPTSPRWNLRKDLPAGLVVFLVALPLCLGIALASNAPLLAGVLSGIIGGLVVGALSGSHTSVTGPAAGLTAIVAAAISGLGSFQAFLVSVALSGAIQIGLGLLRAGFIAAFFPTSVIKGLLAAIGVLLILKQLPHVVGHDPDPVGDLAFEQVDHRTTLSELLDTATDLQPGAALIGLASVVLLVLWDKAPRLKKSPLPAPLMVVLLGLGLNSLLIAQGSTWAVGAEHLVRVPVTESAAAFLSLLERPDWSVLDNTAVYGAAVTLAIVGSLETLLNLEAVDKLDPEQRRSPPNRELIAQGVGNLLAGLVGGLPMTSVVVRGSVNVTAGGKTRLSAITHGGLLLTCVLLIPSLLNQIPLSCLAAILILTGFKLVSPKVVSQMWREGRSQFLPFAATILAIVGTDLLKGIGVGLAVSIGFILHSNLRRPLHKVLEKHVTGNVLRVELANQVSFLNRAALEAAFDSVQQGEHLLLDARTTDYIDPDILDLIHDFRQKTAPARGVTLSLLGFKDRYPRLSDELQFIDYSSREVQAAVTPETVLELLRAGNERFRTGHRLTRDLIRQAGATAGGQAPLAVVLSCIDSRAPIELIFDLGIGDIFSIRIAGNVAKDKVLGSMEYACAVAGAKLIVVLGHTACGAVTAALDLLHRGLSAEQATGCQHLDVLTREIQQSVDADLAARLNTPIAPPLADEAARKNVLRTMRVVLEQSATLQELARTGRIAVVGGLYDIRSAAVEFFATQDVAREGHSLPPPSPLSAAPKSGEPGEGALGGVAAAE